MRFVFLLFVSTILGVAGNAGASVISATTTHGVVGEIYPDSGVFLLGGARADVGSSGPYDVTRGFAEFDLGRLSGPVSSAQLRFNASAVNSCCVGNSILVDGYTGDGLASVGDFQASSSGAIGSFLDSVATIGTLITFDITSLLNSAISNGDLFFGVRLAGDSPWDNNSFLGFDGFEVSVTEAPVMALRSFRAAVPVSAPSGFILLLLGLAGISLLSRRGPARAVK